MKDATFAGHIFVPGEHDGFRFYLWGDIQGSLGQSDQMLVSTSVAEPADGAFLCPLTKGGWIFVAGIGMNNNFRHTFVDVSLAAEENARAMNQLGIPILSIEEGNQRVRDDGVALYSMTADEQRRQAALDRQKQGQQG